MNQIELTQAEIDEVRIALVYRIQDLRSRNQPQALNDALTAFDKINSSNRLTVGGGK